MISLKNHIKESLNKESQIKEVVVKKMYHLSYDILDTKGNQDEYNKYLEHLKSVIKLTEPYYCENICESTFIIAYKTTNIDLIQNIDKNLKNKDKYNIFISKVDKKPDNSFEMQLI